MNVLSKLNIPGTPTLKIRWSPQKAPFKFEEYILKNPRDAHYGRVLHNFEKVPPDILRWSFTANVGDNQKFKAVVRRRLKRRWTAAFQQALKEQGLRNDGKPLGSYQAKTPRSAMGGTVEIYAYGGLDAEYGWLMAQTRAVVYGIHVAIKDAQAKVAHRTNLLEEEASHKELLAAATAGVC